MKTLICRKPGELTLEETEFDAVPDGWVPLDTARVGICGTDYHIFAGNQPFLEYPRVMGHEVSARVSSDYKGSAFTPGELVILNPYLACGTCHACRMGKPNCCENIRVFGVHRDGAMAEKFAAPPENLIRADGLSADQAAMVEFLAIGRHAVVRAGVTKGARSLVIGGGPIGLACGLFARLEGGEVTILDRSKAKCETLSETFGFNTISPDDAWHLKTQELSNTFVFDATGSIHAMNNGLRFVAHGGSYVLVSVVKGDLVFEAPEFHKRETNLLSSRNALADDFEFVVAAIKSGAIDTDSLHTHRTTFDTAAENISAWSDARDDVIKAILEVA
ncbi:MAG: zinc-binding alcohol dehydrogenase family protein [Oceanicola sp.]|nr:zinc-binding alcohol dehydrogenase family protein [Oceanicola sp.]